LHSAKDLGQRVSDAYFKRWKSLIVAEYQYRCLQHDGHTDRTYKICFVNRTLSYFATTMAKRKKTNSKGYEADFIDDESDDNAPPANPGNKLQGKASVPPVDKRRRITSEKQANISTS
jgi:hypothetical protein